MTDFDACTETIQSVNGINGASLQQDSSIADGQAAANAVAEQRKLINSGISSATRFVRMLESQCRSGARHLRKDALRNAFDFRSFDECQAPDSESVARMQLLAMQVRGLDASRSLMAAAGVTHHMSDIVRVIKCASSREHTIRGVEYQHRKRSWIDMLSLFGYVSGEGRLRKLCAGAILADFVLFDTARAPQPDDIDFDCLGLDDRIAFWRMIDTSNKRASIDDITKQAVDYERLLNIDLMAERYAQEYRRRIKGSKRVSRGRA